MVSAEVTLLSPSSHMTHRIFVSTLGKQEEPGFIVLLRGAIYARLGLC